VVGEDGMTCSLGAERAHFELHEGKLSHVP